MSLAPAENRRFLSLVAECCDQAIDAGGLRELREICKRDAEARQIYLDHLFLDAYLHWSLNEGLGAAVPAPNGIAVSCATAGLSSSVLGVDVDSALLDKPAGAHGGTRLTTADTDWFVREVPLVDAQVCPSPAPREPRLAANMPQEAAFSPRGVAIWATAAVLLIACLSLAALSYLRPLEPAFAQLVAVAQPRWPGPAPLRLGDRLPAGKIVRLEYGALEFEFPSRATVVIRGPAEFQVLDHGRFGLTTGELTAHVPRAAAGFAVESVGLVVTDMGTEFALNIGAEGRAQVTVLQGSAEVAAPRDAFGPAQRLALVAGGSVSREAFGNPLAPAPAPAIDSIPRNIAGVRVPLVLRGAGAGLPLGEPDPDWRITHVPDDPNFAARPAIVTSDAPPYSRNDPDRAQWVSLSVEPQETAQGLYVFEHALNLEGFDPETVVVRARVMVDNAVRDVRVNGQSAGLKTPVSAEVVTDRYYELLLERGFAAGRNVLEFDVENFKESRMALRVLFEASGCLAAQRLANRLPPP